VKVYSSLKDLVAFAAILFNFLFTYNVFGGTLNPAQLNSTFNALRTSFCGAVLRHYFEIQPDSVMKLLATEVSS